VFSLFLKESIEGLALAIHENWELNVTVRYTKKIDDHLTNESFQRPKQNIATSSPRDNVQTARDSLNLFLVLYGARSLAVSIICRCRGAAEPLSSIFFSISWKQMS
jgi:hypothetical protein